MGVFQNCKSEKGSGREGGNRREKRPKRDQAEEKMTKQLERRRAGEAETGVIVLGMYFCEYLPVLFSGSGSVCSRKERLGQGLPVLMCLI